MSRYLPNPEEKIVPDGAVRKRSIIAFSMFILLLVGGALLFARLYNEPQSANNVQPTLRKGLKANERLFSLFYSKHREAKSFTKDDAVKKVRVNGDVGMDGTLDTTWRLKVARNPGDTLMLTMD